MARKPLILARAVVVTTLISACTLFFIALIVLTLPFLLALSVTFLIMVVCNLPEDWLEYSGQGALVLLGLWAFFTAYFSAVLFTVIYALKKKGALAGFNAFLGRLWGDDTVEARNEQV
jgi:hypothetical protein